MIELDPEDRKRAIASIQRWCEANLEEPVGNIAAGGLLGYLLEEIAPLVYNRAVADVQERLQMRVAEVDIEVHEEPFTYWQKFDAAGKPRRPR